MTYQVRATKPNGETYVIHDGSKFSRERATAEAEACNRIWPAISFTVEPVTPEPAQSWEEWRASQTCLKGSEYRIRESSSDGSGRYLRKTSRGEVAFDSGANPLRVRKFKTAEAYAKAMWGWNPEIEELTTDGRTIIHRVTNNPRTLPLAPAPVSAPSLETALRALLSHVEASDHSIEAQPLIAAAREALAKLA